MTVFVNFNNYNLTCKYRGGVEMNFIAYIQRQKNLIRSRHEGETFLIENGELIPIPDRDKLLSELDSLVGLNVFERLRSRLRRKVGA